MRKLTASIVIFITLILSSCTATTKAVRYYSLNTNTNDLSMTNKQKNRPRVIIDNVALPELLRQNGLVSQMGVNELYAANYHRWAEPLERSIAKSLVHLLNQKNNNYKFESLAGRWNKGAKYTLRLAFDNFQGSQSGKVIESGHYWFYDQHDKLLLDNNFFSTKDVLKDGYLAVVEQLKLSLDALALKISKDLDAVEVD